MYNYRKIQEKKHEKGTKAAAAVTASVLGLSMAAFAGCNQTPAKPEENEPAGKTKIDPAYTVTKEEWEAAFDLKDKNCTISLFLKPDINSEFALIAYGYFTGDGKDWDDRGEFPGLAWHLNTAYMLNASAAYYNFAFDAETNSYKSTGERSCYMTSPETPTELEGEVKFLQGDLSAAPLQAIWTGPTAPYRRGKLTE